MIGYGREARGPLHVFSISSLPLLSVTSVNLRCNFAPMQISLKRNTALPESLLSRLIRSSEIERTLRMCRSIALATEAHSCGAMYEKSVTIMCWSSDTRQYRSTPTYIAAVTRGEHRAGFPVRACGHTCNCPSVLSFGHCKDSIMQRSRSPIQQSRRATRRQNAMLSGFAVV